MEFLSAEPVFSTFWGRHRKPQTRRPASLVDRDASEPAEEALENQHN